MAICSTAGFEELELSLQEIAELPDEVITDICEAGAIVAEAAIAQAAVTVAPVDSGQMSRSIRRIKDWNKVGGKNAFCFYILPDGERDERKILKMRQFDGYSRRRRNPHPEYLTNAALGYILEYGAPQRGLPAYQWMLSAILKCADDVVRAEYAKYDEYLKSKNL